MHRGRLARAAAVADGQTRYTAQHIRQGLRLQAVDVLAGDDGNGSEGCVGGLRGARGGDDYVRQGFVCVSMGARRTEQCGRQFMFHLKCS